MSSEKILEAIETKNKENKDFFINTISKKDQEIKELREELKSMKKDVIDLNNTKEQVRDLEAQIKSFPIGSEKKSKISDNQFNIFTEEDNVQIGTNLHKKIYKLRLGDSEFLDPMVRTNFRKAYNPTVNIAGASIVSQGLFTPLLQGNIARNYGTVIPITNASKFSIPKLSSATFIDQTAVGTPALNDSASLSYVDVTIKSLASETKLSHEALADLPALDGIQMQNLILNSARTEGKITFDALKNTLATKGGIIPQTNAELSGVANALPPATGNNGIFNKLLLMMSKLSNAYTSSPNCAWFMSKQAFQRIMEANTNNINYFDATLGTNTLFGYPIVKADYFDDGNANGEVPIIFGDMARGLILGTRQELTIGKYEGHSLGHMTYYGKLRSGVSVWDEEALVKMVIGTAF